MQIIPGDLTAAPTAPDITTVAITSGSDGEEVEVTVMPPKAGREFLAAITLVEVQSEPDALTLFAPPFVPLTFRGLKGGIE